MPSQEEIDQQQVLLNTHRRSLAILLRQKAVAPGASTPLPVEHGIVEARSNIRRVKNILSGWGVSVANHPDDEDDSSASPQTSRSSTTVSAPSATSASKSPSQTNQKRVSQRDLAWWAGVASIAALVVALGQLLLRNPFPTVPQPFSSIATEFRQSTSTQPTLPPITLAPSPVSSPEASAPTRSTNPTVLNPTTTECQSDAYDFVAQIPPQPPAVDYVQFGDGLVETVHDGYIYVAHTTKVPNIQKLTTTGKVVIDWKVQPGMGEGEFRFAQAIAVGSDGNVYVVDGGGKEPSRIQKLDGKGEFRVWVDENSGAGMLKDPRSITIDSQDNVYIADTLNNRIVKFSSEGTFQTSWGEFGSDKGKFNQPWGIGVDIKENVIYVADTGNNRIQKFDSEGNYQGEWGVKGSGDGQFTEPRGVNVDSEGNVYVADSTNHRIQKFSSIGKCLAKWGHEGKAIGELEAPRTVSFGADGLVYVADAGNRRIQVFRAR